MDAIAQRKEESLEFKERAERAIEAFNVQNFKRAEQHLSSAIEFDPESHAIELDPENHAMEKFERALRDANECVRLQPTWAKGYSRQAAAFLSMGDLQAARDACMRGLCPSFPRGEWSLGVACGRPSNDVSGRCLGLDLEPENSQFLHYRLLVGGQVKEELRRVEIAESLALKDAATEAFKGQDYEKAAMQLYEKALEDADECVRLQPTWAKGYSRRAAAKFHLGDLQAPAEGFSPPPAWDLEPTNAKTKADLEHVLSEIAGMRVVLPERAS
ncbi:hypothetical protein EMIHUDRAFT_247902 [Emiliania huxleyi CCMP1516]|uniref:Uncharacterized protein n=2 Tax=Emiliania huxleyi TaxID=2903 RepID=A0A0D3IJP3_EMIH1|nr:hypothetical protein EMIHUDRAFT_247902 [Emiliania huxleyi CCMP1516]EOD11478.1 hypothetical protein EMIHUDRAFT_247902 [Emiliania huxleyi CCMP1516]|eukprot:XP_005763907.1 hypothetical protein EMIHUDRAFT_247902 [Emiliania huxleyi CCMP1516]